MMKRRTLSGLIFGSIVSVLVAFGCGGGGHQTPTPATASLTAGTYPATYGYSDGGFYSATGSFKAYVDAQGHVTGVFRNSSSATIDDIDPNVLGARDSGTVTGDFVSGQANLKFTFRTDPNSHQFPVNNYAYLGPYTVYTQGRLKMLKVKGSNWAVFFTIGTT